MNIRTLLNVPVGETTHIFNVFGELVDIVEVIAHAIIFMVRGYDPITQYKNILNRVL